VYVLRAAFVGGRRSLIEADAVDVAMAKLPRRFIFIMLVFAVDAVPAVPTLLLSSILL
jgi:hypothetical protein